MSSSIAKYVSILKSNGLAVNNLYDLEISLPSGTLKTMLEEQQKYNTLSQIDMTRKPSQEEAHPVIMGMSQGFADGIGSGTLGTLGSMAKGAAAAKFAPQINAIKGLFGKGGIGDDGGGPGQDTFKTMELVSMLCTSTQIPFYKHKLEKTFINHMEKKFASGVDTDPVKMTFYVDRGNAVLSFFEQWHQLIHISGDRTGVMKYKAEYGADITIKMINKSTTGEFVEVFSGTIRGAYPAFIEPIVLNNNNTEIVQLNVQFEYDKVDFKVNRPLKESKISTKELKTGFNILDMKNKAEQGINSVREVAKTGQNLVKSTGATVEDMKNTAKRVFKF